MNATITIWKIIGWLFGIIFLAIGLVNTFWGNDPGFGVFIILLAFIYFPPVNGILKRKTGYSVPGFVKVLVGIFIVWASLGVGELFDKIEMMMNDFNT